MEETYENNYDDIQNIFDNLSVKSDNNEQSFLMDKREFNDHIQSKISKLEKRMRYVNYKFEDLKYSYAGDLSAIINTPSPCGRTNIRIKGWMGRAEQSTKVKGIFITPEQIHKLTNNFLEISKARLVIESKDFLDDPVLICEVNKRNNIQEEDIKAFFKSQFKLNIRVNFVNEGNIINDGIIIEDKRNKN